jgi:hypothetical protein
MLTSMTLAVVLAAPAAPGMNAGDFVYRAVYAGLVEDGVPPALAADQGKREDFIGKCDICEPTRRAFADYGKLKDPQAPKDGKGLSAELAKRLKSDDDTTRRLALRELVHRYTERGFEKLDATKEQKVALQAELEKMRKLAAGGLPRGQKFCPSCDGACRLTPKL